LAGLQRAVPQLPTRAPAPVLLEGARRRCPWASSFWWLTADRLDPSLAPRGAAELRADSVQRKRKSKMNKHKHRKRRKLNRHKR
jgi:hypothetical protein